MITEHTHPEHNDWQKPDGEPSSASESFYLPQPTNISLTTEPAEPVTLLADQPMPTPVKANVDMEQPIVETVHPTPLPEPSPLLTTEETFARVSELFVAEQPVPLESEVLPHFNLEEAHVSLSESVPFSETEMVRPFTDFIEEFRQAEVRLNTLEPDQEPSFATMMVEHVEHAEMSAVLEVVDEPVQREETPREEETINQVTEAQSIQASPLVAIERPISPLLRPATRLRLPRHGRHRVEEPISPQSVELPKLETVTPEEQATSVEVPQSEEPIVRPTRRYRFDRPATTANANLPQPKAPAASSSRSAEVKEKHVPTAEPKPSPEKAALATAPEMPTPKPSVPEPEPVSAEASVATPPPANERRKRGNHERQREKEPVVPPVAPVAEVPALEKEPTPAPEVPVEDLPPLEYAELQAASSRRRRRRRLAAASPTPSSNGAVAPKAVAPDSTFAVTSMPSPSPSNAAVPAPKSAPATPVAPPVTPNYNIVSGYTVSQMNQGNDGTGPFMGPEPSPARGSTFTTTPQVRHARSEVLRSTASTAHVVKQTESPLLSSAAVNHLGNIVSQAIQVQTDRMVAELRRANQVPTNISVSLPPFPSSERVGVFVDVANLLYSARTLRMNVDFGKLLDFLRGNRRLVRAQAYCPTSPQPGDDQMFLQAVKGLGYRITTKNYKTFSSGAKKADLDLDLCMDVVRLVDGKAVDCIVLVSGDSDFMPMLDYCSDHGVRVEVAAFDESMSATLRQSCDLFVNLSMLEEIRS